MKRHIAEMLDRDLKRKPILLSGPRQCGKTFISKKLASGNIDYLNFDIPQDRKRLIKMDWDRNKELVIFDEIHKMKKWKNWLKGIFDSDRETQKFLVTGSAKLQTLKKVGDSLAGRYFSYRLYPLDLKEVLNESQSASAELKFIIKQKDAPNFILNRLLNVSGFPEPFLTNEDGFYERWRQTHLDVILKQDILETESVKNIKQLETLVIMLTERVGSTLSYNSLSEDLITDDKSIKRWVDILENSYVIFRIYPYVSKAISGGLKKAPKLYFFDIARVENSGHRFENLVALSLLKEIHYRMDTRGEVFDLHYLRNKQKKEIDFLITKNKKPHLLIEAKESDDEVSDSFSAFDRISTAIKKIQIVKNLKEKRLTKSGVWLIPAAEWLAEMDLS